MSLSSQKNSSIRYGLVVFLILTLFICAIFLYIKNNKGNELSHNVQQLTELKEDYSLIDSCIIVLYNADNNCRLYAVTGQKSYIQKFVSDINFVSGILNNIPKTSNFNKITQLFPTIMKK